MTDAERIAALEQEIREINRQLLVLFDAVGRVASVIKTEQIQEDINAGILKEMDLIKASRNRAQLTVLPGKDSDGDT